MSALGIDTVNAPAAVKDKLRDLSRTVLFDRESRKGANGWLFFGTNSINKTRIAVKFYDWGGDPSFHAEPRHLAELDSPNVINILDCALVDRDYAYFMTPCLPAGDLDDQICRGIRGNLWAVNLARDVLSGLSFLHAKRLVHRDLKPQNILLSDEHSAVIGDFGSVKSVPEGQVTVPGSGHALIYRPPESVSSGVYGVPGDIYQVGVVLYQLLGGALPYDEASWLNSRQLRKYRQLPDAVDRQVFANRVIMGRIERGRIIDRSSLPPWVCSSLRRTVAKACSIDPEKRFQSCSEFLAQIASIRRRIHDWRLEDGFPTRIGEVSHRLVRHPDTDSLVVQKRRSGKWRYDYSFNGTTVTELVDAIDRKYA